MKRAFAALLLAALLLLTGCEFSSSVRLMSVSQSTSTSFSMSYMKFTGTEKYTIRAKADNMPVEMTIESESGTLGVKILDARGKIVYEAIALETGHYTIILAEAGKYSVRVEAQEHSGSYRFDWGE